MPDNATNDNFSLGALLAAARDAQSEAATSEADNTAQSEGASTSGEGAQSSKSSFDLAAALGYTGNGSNVAGSSGRTSKGSAVAMDDSFDLMAALGFNKPTETATNETPVDAPTAEASAQASTMPPVTEPGIAQTIGQPAPSQTQLTASTTAPSEGQTAFSQSSAQVQPQSAAFAQGGTSTQASAQGSVAQQPSGVIPTVQQSPQAAVQLQYSQPLQATQTSTAPQGQTQFAQSQVSQTQAPQTGGASTASASMQQPAQSMTQQGQAQPQQQMRQAAPSQNVPGTVTATGIVTAVPASTPLPAQQQQVAQQPMRPQGQANGAQQRPLTVRPLGGAQQAGASSNNAKLPPMTSAGHHKAQVTATEEFIQPRVKPVQPVAPMTQPPAFADSDSRRNAVEAEARIEKRIRRYRRLGTFLTIIAVAALAGAVLLFVAGSAQASENLESTATKISEQAGKTITFKYKAADSNGTMCPTTEVATFSSGGVLEQSVITMETTDFEAAAHTLAYFKKQFQDSSYVDGRVDNNTVIFTLHMTNERLMKKQYTALLMSDTIGCEVVI